METLKPEDVHVLTRTHGLLTTTGSRRVLTRNSDEISFVQITAADFWKLIRDVSKKNPLDGSAATIARRRLMLTTSRVLFSYKSSGDRYLAEHWQGDWAKPLQDILYGKKVPGNRIYEITFDDRVCYFWRLQEVLIDGDSQTISLSIDRTDNIANALEFLKAEEGLTLPEAIDPNEVPEEILPALNKLHGPALYLYDALPVLYSGKTVRQKAWAVYTAASVVSAVLIIAAVLTGIWYILAGAAAIPVLTAFGYRRLSGSATKKIPSTGSALWSSAEKTLDSVSAEFMSYELDTSNIFQQILLSDRTDSTIAAFYNAFEECNALHFDQEPDDRVLVQKFYDATQECRRAWNAAVALVNKTHWDSFTLEQQKLLRRGEAFLQIALSPASTPAEANAAYERIVEVLNEVRIMPVAVKQLRRELTQ